MPSSVLTIAVFLCLCPTGCARRTEVDALREELAMQSETAGLCDQIPAGLCSPQYKSLCKAQCDAKQAEYDAAHPTEAGGQSRAQKLGGAAMANRCSNLPEGPCSAVNNAICADACALKQDSEQPSTGPKSSLEGVGAQARATRCDHLPDGPCSAFNEALCKDKCAEKAAEFVAPAVEKPRAHGGAKSALCKTVVSSGQRCNPGFQWQKCEDECAELEPEECKALAGGDCTEKWQQNKCPDYCVLLKKRKREDQAMVNHIAKEVDLMSFSPQRQSHSKSDLDEVGEVESSSPQLQANSASDLESHPLTASTASVLTRD